MAVQMWLTLLCVQILCGLCLSSHVLLAKVGRSQTAHIRRTRETTDLIPKITDMIIVSETSARFVKVKVSGVIVNEDTQDREARFTVQMPQTAFISDFTMVIDNELLVAQVKSKEEAQRLYDEARNESQSAGHVSQNAPSKARDMDMFTVAVNVANMSSVKMELTYQELLDRRFEHYVHKISVRPNQIIPNMTLVATYREPKGFTDFQYVTPGSTVAHTASSSAVQMMNPNTSTKKLIWTPSLQTQYGVNKQTGINGEFVVTYDTNHEFNGGLIIVGQEGHFVQYFSLPSDSLQILSKNVIFVIDISGSMGGRKIEQARQSMLVILGKLRPQDYFSILVFDDNVKTWNDRPVIASETNIVAAKAYVTANVRDRGSTNINAALTKALTIIRQQVVAGTRDKLILFLTDGSPTAGETNTHKIRENVRRMNENTISIFSLGFGYGLDFQFLKALSWENRGFARRIYEDVDAAKQLEGFFEEVADPLLLNVVVRYQDDVVDEGSLTQTTFPQYYKGSELVISGKLAKNAPSIWEATVVGVSADTNVALKASPTTLEDSIFTEKLWAYMKIKDLLREAAISETKPAREDLEAFALNMSLQYHFVTPLTSMVIVQSDTRTGGDLGGQQDVYASMGIGGADALISRLSTVMTLVSITLSVVL